MEFDLLDVSVWIPLVHTQHPHHERATSYWQESSAERIAFCEVTSLAFFRLLSNPEILNGKAIPHDLIWEIYESYLALPEVIMAEANTKTYSAYKKITTRDNFQTRLSTDAWLAALAQSHNARLVTFDHDFKKFTGLKHLILE